MLCIVYVYVHGGIRVMLLRFNKNLSLLHVLNAGVILSPASQDVKAGCGLRPEHFVQDFLSLVKRLNHLGVW